MRAFFDNLMAVLPSTEFTSREQLSAATFPGRPKYITNAAGKGQEISLRNAKAIADQLGVSLDRLAREDQGAQIAQWSAAPDYRDVIALHDKASGAIEGMGSILDFVDLFHPPTAEDKAVRPYHMGRHSLASRILERRGCEALEHAIASWSNDALDKRIKTAYQAAMGGVRVITIETFHQDIAIEPWSVHTRYMRLLLAVHDGKGRRYVLNYSIELEPPSTSSATINRSARAE